MTREALREELWPEGTFVDFEHSLNTAVKKLRDALGDDADNPRFVETLPRRGYRFIVPVDGAAQPVPAPGTTETLTTKAPPGVHAGSRRRVRAAVLSAVLLGGTGAAFWLADRSPTPGIGASAQLTYSGTVMVPDHFREIFPALATDGSRIYFSQFSGGMPNLAQVAVSGGDVVPIPAPIEQAPVLLNISPDGSRLLVAGHSYGTAEGPLWIVSTVGGATHRLGEVLAHDGAWSRAGDALVYAQGQDLYVAKADGSEPRRLVSTPGGRAYWIRWAPDGSRIRFTLVDRDHSRRLWEVSPDGTNLHPLALPGQEDSHECCGEWTPDGRYFLYVTVANDREDIWFVRERGHWRQGSGGKATRLSTGPLRLRVAIPSADGRNLFVAGLYPAFELLRRDRHSGELAPFVSRGWSLGFSRDGQWVAYVDGDGRVWRSRVDGSERRLLVAPPSRFVHTLGPRWSPDSKTIAFAAKAADKPWKVYLVSAEGGIPQPLLTDERNETDGDWSPDGGKMLLGRPPDYMAESGASKAIHVVDLKTRQVVTLAGSVGLFSPRWSPDGRYIVAITLDHRRLMVFDLRTDRWTELLSRDTLENPIWSRDGLYVHVQAWGTDSAVWRIRIADRHVERIAGTRREDIKRTNVRGCGLDSLAPDDSLILACPLGLLDLYSLEWDAR